MEFYAGPRGRHHFGYGIAPFRVMCGVLVPRRRLRCAICLNQNKMCGIVDLLHDIELRNSGLLHARLGILNGRLPEGIDILGLNLNVYMNNEHRVFIHLASLRFGTNLTFGAGIVHMA